ncbi:class D sortase [Niallia sp. Sow4_A1]|jgi:sortase A|uniref:class D sortase n=1 Tax=Bacillaceae TaxID=186817 RepID=UPI0004E1D410|nr:MULTISPECIES: class D sortase [Bacillaceae]MCM3364575.1 class D sortase [Niallia sp. MER TA 168]
MNKPNKIGVFFLSIGLIMVFYSLSSYWKINAIIEQPVFQPSRQMALSNLRQVQPGEKIGAIIVPNTKKSIPIYEGTSAKILEKGAGHYRKSALPGENNNIVLSGHRDTFFRFLKDLEKNDSLILETRENDYEYKVTKFSIVDSNDSTILTPKSRPILTLTTCYPFAFIGNAPKRYIVTAELINTIALVNK